MAIHPKNARRADDPRNAAALQSDAEKRAAAEVLIDLRGDVEADPDFAPMTQVYFDGRFAVVSRDGLRAPERAILGVLPANREARVLVVGNMSVPLAAAYRVLNPQARVTIWVDDDWYLRQGKRTWDALTGANEELVSAMKSDTEWLLAAEFPEGPFDAILVPLEKRGVTDLVRERVRLAAQRLAPKGLLYASSDDARDNFVRGEIKKTFGALALTPDPSRYGGIAYVSRRPAQPLSAPPRATDTFDISEGGAHLAFESRIGVFCHGRLDDGTRALLARMDVAGASRILDLGCGCGVVGVVAALRNPDAKIVFLDSHARSVACAESNAHAHGIADRATYRMTSDLANGVASDGPFDLIITNPPYYGNRRIATDFVELAGESLRPGGRLQLVTKDPEWYAEPLEANGLKLEKSEKLGGYAILTAVRTAAPIRRAD